MPKSSIHVFGNPDIAIDSLPLRILPLLSEQFPSISFVTLDPNEEWDIPDPFIVIDTVLGLDDIHMFRSLDEFGRAPTVSVHDFDALFYLRYLAKLGKLKGVCVIGIPPDITVEKAFAKTTSAIKSLMPFLDEDQ